MIKKESKNTVRKRRHRRVRNKVFGTAERPRLNVFRSLQHMYVNFIDDENNHTLLSVSSLDQELKDKVVGRNNRETARLVGELAGKKAKALKIDRAVFDRGGYKYHGRVKELADAIRAQDIEF
ncbi:MAG: 50S ribosomal protein L18 [Firmicutes bacterium]|jgi:large subunit ribosomal protein L18|nr:50S ribosomal protein L18 [Bacillota bacterium]